MQATGNYQFNQWWSVHQEDFVAHATYNNKVIEDRMLKCAEEVFRTEGQVEHEIGYGRKTSTYIKEGRAPNVAFIYHTGRKKQEGGYPNCMVIPNFAVSANFLERAEKRGHRVEDKVEYVKVYTGERIPIQGCVQYHADVLASDIK